MATRVTEAFNRLQIKPLLFISIEPPILLNTCFKDSWYLKNGAKNAAVNVMVRFSIDQFTTQWVSCFSLSESEKLELFWIQFAEQIEVVLVI
jgi:hypothetical protein